MLLDSVEKQATLESPRDLPTPLESGQRTKADNTRKPSIEEGFVTLGKIGKLETGLNLKDEKLAANEAIGTDDEESNQQDEIGDASIMALVSNDEAKSSQAVNAEEMTLNRRDPKLGQDMEPDLSHAKLADRNSGLREQLKSAGEISCATAEELQKPVQINS